MRINHVKKEILPQVLETTILKLKDEISVRIADIKNTEPLWFQKLNKLYVALVALQDVTGAERSSLEQLLLHKPGSESGAEVISANLRPDCFDE